MQIHLTSEWKRQLKRLWWLLLYPAAFLLKEWAALFPNYIEQFYSNAVYPVISSGVGWFFGLMPFSFSEFLLYALIVALAVFVVFCIVRAVQKKLTAVRFVSFIITILIIGGAAFNAFYWMWGFNYYRYPISYSMQLDVKEREPQELANLCASLAFTAVNLREVVSEDDAGVFCYSVGKQEMLLEIPAAYAELAKYYPQFSKSTPAPKPVLASEQMSYAGIAGIFIPFTAEANVNMHETPLLLASSAAHESAHFMGIAREDEANFIGYLACISSKDPAVAYSGVMLALINAGNMLNQISPQTYAQLRGLYSEGMNRDLASYNAYREHYKGMAEEIVSEINNSYLKQHNQQDGIMSYGRMIDLMLAFYDPNIRET